MQKASLSQAYEACFSHSPGIPSLPCDSGQVRLWRSRCCEIISCTYQLYSPIQPYQSAEPLPWDVHTKGR